MKNFFKKLSFVLAIAMVLTTLAPATASAAAKNYAKVNGKKAASTTAFFGGVERKIVPYFNGKTSSKVTVSYSKEGIAKVENNGVVKPLKNGTTVVTFKSGKNTVNVTVKVRTRAKALNIYDRAEYKAGKKDKLTAVELKVGEKKDLQVTMPIYAKAKKAGAVKSSYYTYASTSDDAVV
ncbi:MAG: hypothetical protein K5858_07845, partial [Lachnospiraceae bacterium]|nr:hypothetical protein [Lachnospiraceae bacterium]